MNGQIELTEPTELDQPTPAVTHLRAFERLHAISAAVIVAVAVAFPVIVPEASAQTAPIYALAAVLALFAFAWHRFIPESQRGLRTMLIDDIAQIAAASGLVGLAGGTESPLIFLFYPPLVLAGLTVGLPAALFGALLGTTGLLAATFVAAAGSSASVSAATLANVIAVWIVALTAGLLGREVNRSQQNMADAKDRAERFSSVDWLTGLYNRRHLDTLVPQEIARARRHDRPVSLMIADADHLKEVNDTLGHLLGDQLLIHIAEVLLAQVRLVDTVIRYGGDEFIVIMPETDSEGALIPAERIRASMDGYEVSASGITVRTSISVGIASFPIDADEALGLLARADQALYISKRSGRNRVTLYRPDLPTERTPLARELEVVE